MTGMAEEEIPVLDLAPEIRRLGDELLGAIRGVLTSGRFILGPNVRAFEEEVAAYVGVKHAVGVNSGTDALVIGMRALGIGPGDEVITTSFTFAATPEAIANVGATPVFVDIDPSTFDLDPGLIEPAVTERTKAVVPVHLYGQACDMSPILDVARRHGLAVVEDVAQAMGGAYRGSKLGSLGDVGALSFFPSKNLGGFGDGGMLVTNDADIAERARMLRTHGAKAKYDNEVLGYNSRLDELQAAMLRVKLPHLDEANLARRAVAEQYDTALADARSVETPAVAPDAIHVYHQYTVRVREGNRDALRGRLAARGIQTAIYYPVPCHRLRPFASERPLPVTEAAAASVLSLPMGPALDRAAIERVAGAIT